MASMGPRRRSHPLPDPGRRFAALVGGVVLLAVGLGLSRLSVAGSARASAPAAVRASGVNPFAGQRFPVQTGSDAHRTARMWRHQGRSRDARLIEKIARTPQAAWFGDWSSGHGSTYADVRAQVEADRAQHAMSVLVAYDIPWRDCGGQSTGGAASPSAYADFIDQLARGIGSAQAAVVLEPDALAELGCLSMVRQEAYYQMLSGAVARLSRSPHTAVYLDAGNSHWLPAATIARRLRRAGVAQARGFALNVSNFEFTRSAARFGRQIVRRLGGGHFVIDTSRNGRGPAPGHPWCNPPGRGLGSRPTTRTGDPEIDAYYWIKAPGESDGRCGVHGAPAAGVWWPSYALMLARNATF